MTQRGCLPWTVAILIPLILILAFACHGINRSLEAEYTLHAYRTVLTVLDLHITQNPGQWPTSWDDLTRTAIPEKDQRGMFRWPDDVQKIQKRLHIDFGLKVADVAKMTPDNFTAVQQLGPSYAAG